MVKTIFHKVIKTTCDFQKALTKLVPRFVDSLQLVEHSAKDYRELRFEDISDEDVKRIAKLEDLTIPAIPNVSHWFRNYVVVDLARIRKTISSMDASRDYHNFLLLCFGAIIRRCSNADPVPVSGLEVTAHMKELNKAGRVVDPFEILIQEIGKSLKAFKAFGEAVESRPRVFVERVNTAATMSRFEHEVDAVISSPPYNNAVDYYRRHTLEMYWLGLTPTRKDRLELLHQYIGRSRVAAGSPYLGESIEDLPYCRRIHSKMSSLSPNRANSFKHYVVAMRRSLGNLAKMLRHGGKLVLVVGDSTWNDQVIRSSDVLYEVARDDFVLSERYWYPIRNRHMSYSRHNGASIEKENVLVFVRK